MSSIFRTLGISQKSPLVAEGVAELLPHTGGEVRVHGRIHTDLETECDRCLGRAAFHIDAPFDLFTGPWNRLWRKKKRLSTKAKPKWDSMSCPA